MVWVCSTLWFARLYMHLHATARTRALRRPARVLQLFRYDVYAPAASISACAAGACAAAAACSAATAETTLASCAASCIVDAGSPAAPGSASIGTAIGALATGYGSTSDARVTAAAGCIGL